MGNSPFTWKMIIYGGSLPLQFDIFISCCMLYITICGRYTLFLSGVVVSDRDISAQALDAVD